MSIKYLQEVYDTMCQDFRTLSRRDGVYRENDACCQFQFRGRIISASKIGVADGGCLVEVAVCDQKGEYLKRTHTVEEAIDWCTENPL